MSNEENHAKISFLERMARNVISSVTSKTIFGEAVEHHGIKVIPVAKIRYGFGGGYGHKKPNDTGKGGGGGAMAQPVGYIEINNGQTAFKAIPNLVSLSSAILIAGIIGLWMCKKAR